VEDPREEMSITREKAENRKKFYYILKPVGSACNLACDYCYYNFSIGKVALRKWGDKELETLFKKMLLKAKTVKGEKVKVCFDLNWHGGEPLLAGIPFYEKVVHYQESLLKELPESTNVRFFNSIQTNGVLIDDDYASFLSKNGFEVGVSFDGTPELHDLHRKDRNGKGTAEKVVEGIKTIQKYEIKPGILCVVTKDSVGKEEEIYRFLKEELKVNSLSILPFLNLKARKFSLSPEDYAAFMIRLFHVWMDDDDPSFMIREFVSWIRSFLGGEPFLCAFSKNACGSFTVINNDFTVSFCDEYYNIPEFKLGTFFDNEEVLSERILSIRNYILAQKEKCFETGCKYANICNRGCPRMWTNHSNFYCKAYKKIFSEIENRLSFFDITKLKEEVKYGRNSQRNNS
jgi:uncharacterized protein